MRRLIVLLAAAVPLLAQRTCNTDCKEICATVSCVQACSKACTDTALQLAEPHFQLELVHTFPENTVITGSDAPSKPRGRALYFTTLKGEIFRYNAETEKLRLMHTLSPEMLDCTGGKGLYDVALHRDYDKNGRLYVHFSAPPVNKTELGHDHDNVIVELETLGGAMHYVREVARFAQYSSERSGGWAKMGIRDVTLSGKPWLYVALGGNREELLERIEGSPALSTIYAIAQPDNATQRQERVWASGIQNPLDCDFSVFKLDRVVCLIEDASGRRRVLSIRKGYNYGSDEFVKSCRGSACQQQYADLASKSALVSFEPGDCSVRSVQHYTGHRMHNYHLDIFLSRDACYDAASNRFRPADILRIYRDHSAGQYKTVAMPTNMPTSLLVNTTLVGADKLDDFYLAGYSLRDGGLQLYRIVPVKAAE